MADESVTDVVRRYLRNLRAAGLRDPSAVLFGSFARGAAHEWSDIDLIVVSPRYDAPFALDDVETLWIVAARTDSRIEPVPCGQRQWLEDDQSVLIETARREGRRIDGDDRPY
jgi:predicted nucleotidyltransferase